MQEIKDLFEGQEKHLIEHFWHIIFLHILHNKEQFIHMIFLHELFSHIFEQVKQILLLQMLQFFQLLLFEHILHLFISLKFIFSFLFIIVEHSGHFILLFCSFEHNEQNCLLHLMHFIPQFSILFSLVEDRGL